MSPVVMNQNSNFDSIGVVYIAKLVMWLCCATILEQENSTNCTGKNTTTLIRNLKISGVSPS